MSFCKTKSGRRKSCEFRGSVLRLGSGLQLSSPTGCAARGGLIRSQGTPQDRFVKKLRRRGIRTRAEASRSWEEYCQEHQAR